MGTWQAGQLKEITTTAWTDTGQCIPVPLQCHLTLCSEKLAFANCSTLYHASALWLRFITQAEETKMQKSEVSIYPWFHQIKMWHLHCQHSSFFWDQITQCHQGVSWEQRAGTSCKAWCGSRVRLFSTRNLFVIQSFQLLEGWKKMKWATSEYPSIKMPAWKINLKTCYIV